MRTGWLSWLLVLVFCAICSARQTSSPESYAGTWSGTWNSEAAGSGKFDLVLEKGKDGALAGKVAVTADGGGGDYTAELQAITFDGNKMGARYDFPLNPSAEIIVAADFDDHSAKGTWSLRPKGQSAELVGGKWTVEKR